MSVDPKRWSQILNELQNLLPRTAYGPQTAVVQKEITDFMKMNPNTNLVIEYHNDSTGMKPLIALKGKLWI